MRNQDIATHVMEDIAKSTMIKKKREIRKLESVWIAVSRPERGSLGVCRVYTSKQRHGMLGSATVRSQISEVASIMEKVSSLWISEGTFYRTGAHL